VGDVIDLSEHIPHGRSQPSDMAIVKRAEDQNLTWDPVEGQMRGKTTQEVGLEAPDKDPVGNALYDNKYRNVSNPPSIWHTAGNVIGNAQRHPIAQSIGKGLFGHGALLGGLTGAGAGYGVGKLYNKFTNSDSSVMPIILSLLGGVAGGAISKTGSWKSPDSFGKSGVIDQIIDVISESASAQQQRSARTKLLGMSSSEVGSILSAVQSLMPAAATAAVLKILGVSNMGAMMGAIALGALTYSSDTNTAGMRVKRYKLL
jgi:hypothetical protein